jgi:tetratricopeptide (TPR) repeat protein
MALRIADSPPETTSPVPTALAPRADREADYRALRAALEARLGAAGATAARELPALFASVAVEALAGLAAEPCEPVLLNYAGVGLYELGAREAATDLFGAALRLDPELPHALDNLEQARRRRSTPPLPAAVNARLPLLERQARELTARAVPASGLTLSLCMIVKDEAEMLPRSLAAARDAVDEIVVVDTGSSDETVAIARSFGARVIEREWTGSFAEARNTSFDAAGGDWVLYLDADEVLVAEDAPLLRELTGRTWREAFYLIETNHTGELGDGTAVTHNALRLFRNRAEYRFEGRLHEQIAHRLPGGLPERLEQTGIRVDHYGYLGAVRDAKEKSRRNIELLRRQLAETGSTPFLCFNLGSELAAAGDAEAAREQFERAWELLAGDPRRAELGYLPSLTTRLVKSLRVCGREELAARRAEEGLELFPELTDLVFEQALLARGAGDLDASASLLEDCLRRGDAPSRHSATVGCGGYLALVRLAEVELEREDSAAAEQLLARCLREHPGYLGSVLPLAQALLRRGAAPEEVVATIEAGVTEMTPSVRFMTATALYEAGHPAAAEPLFAAVVSAQPGNGSARLALAETLLSQRRFVDAAVEAAAVEDDGPAALAAARSELFARGLAGAPLDEAFARADRRALPTVELTLLRIWSSRSRSGSNGSLAWDAGGAYPGLDPACLAPLATMLEALLRIEEFEAFEALLPALDACGLEPRARQQLLAETYFRRGYLESAADEWIAAVERHGPDPEALAGLSRVASARGLDDDARIFAEQAQELASSSR